jgi:RHS repeat-associated protein
MTSRYDTEYRFTGRRFDHETALYYYRQRTYCCNLGVFVSPDTFPRGDVHRYLYVAARPIELVDPSGRSFVPPVLTAMGLCCQEYYLRTKDLFNPPIGVTLCCGQLMVICVYPQHFKRYGITDPQATDIVKSCVYAHEKVHTQQCRCTFERLPGFRCIYSCKRLKGYESKALRECLAFQAALACLKAKKADCGSNMLCHEQVDKHIHNYVEFAMDNLGCKAILKGIK